MKLKKVKRLVQLASAFLKYNVKDLHVVMRKEPLSTGEPGVFLPITGPYVKPETREIIRIVKGMNPNTIVADTNKINAQAGIKLFTVFGDDKFPNIRAVFFSTPYGFIVTALHVEPEIKKVNNVEVEINEPDTEIDISQEYQLL